MAETELLPYLKELYDNSSVQIEDIHVLDRIWKEQEYFVPNFALRYGTLKPTGTFWEVIPYLKFPNLAIVSMRRKESGISVPVLYVDAGKLQIPAGKRVKRSFRIIALFFCRRYGIRRIRINRWISGTVHKWKILVNSSLYQTVCMLMELHCSQIWMCCRVCYIVCGTKWKAIFTCCHPVFTSGPLFPKRPEAYADPCA